MLGTVERLNLQDELLEKPVFVRLKFLGASAPTAKQAPKKGSLRDVRVRSLEDLVECVDEWLGEPGSWQLSTAANWPLTTDAFRRPTSKGCPLVVNVRNTQEMLLRRLEALAESHERLELKLSQEEAKRDAEVCGCTNRLSSLELAIHEFNDLTDLNITNPSTLQVRTRAHRFCRCCACGSKHLMSTLLPFLASIMLCLLVYWISMIENEVVGQAQVMQLRIERNDDELHTMQDQVNALQDNDDLALRLAGELNATIGHAMNQLHRVHMKLLRRIDHVESRLHQINDTGSQREAAMLKMLKAAEADLMNATAAEAATRSMSDQQMAMVLRLANESEREQAILNRSRQQQMLLLRQVRHAADALGKQAARLQQVEGAANQSIADIHHTNATAEEARIAAVEAKATAASANATAAAARAIVVVAHEIASAANASAVAANVSAMEALATAAAASSTAAAANATAASVRTAAAAARSQALVADAAAAAANRSAAAARATAEGARATAEGARKSAAEAKAAVRREEEGWVEEANRTAALVRNATARVAAEDRGRLDALRHSMGEEVAEVNSTAWSRASLALDKARQALEREENLTRKEAALEAELQNKVRPSENATWALKHAEILSKEVQEQEKHFGRILEFLQEPRLQCMLCESCGGTHPIEIGTANGHDSNAPCDIGLCYRTDCEPPGNATDPGNQRPPVASPRVCCHIVRFGLHA